MLRGSLTDVVFKPGTRNCKVLSGTLQSDPYTGQTIHYTSTQANALQVARPPRRARIHPERTARHERCTSVPIG